MSDGWVHKTGERPTRRNTRTLFTYFSLTHLRVLIELDQHGGSMRGRTLAHHMELPQHSIGIHLRNMLAKGELTRKTGTDRYGRWSEYTLTPHGRSVLIGAFKRATGKEYK